MTAAVFFGVALWVNLKEPDLCPSQKALALFNAGEYKQAALECEKTQDLQIAVPFSDVCRAYMSYEEGDVKEARRRLDAWAYLRKNSKTEYPEYFLKQVLALFVIAILVVIVIVWVKVAQMRTNKKLREEGKSPKYYEEQVVNVID